MTTRYHVVCKLEYTSPFPPLSHLSLSHLPCDQGAVAILHKGKSEKGAFLNHSLLA